VHGAGLAPDAVELDPAVETDARSEHELSHRCLRVAVAIISYGD